MNTIGLMECRRAKELRLKKRNRRVSVAVAVGVLLALGIVGDMDRKDAEVVASAPLLPVVNLEVKRPEITKAQALVESNANPYVRPGDGGKSRGMFQVQSRYWGVVPKDARGQQIQNERIMDELLEATQHPMKALSRYNGSGPAADRYAAKVRAKAIEISLLENNR